MDPRLSDEPCSEEIFQCFLLANWKAGSKASFRSRLKKGVGNDATDPLGRRTFLSSLLLEVSAGSLEKKKILKKKFKECHFHCHETQK